MILKGCISVHWSDKYIGLEYSKYNCAEFVALVAKNEYSHDIILPKNVGKFLRAQQKKINNHFFNYVYSVNITKPIEGCVVLMHGRKHSCHIGIFTYINKVGYVVHSMSGFNSVVRHKVSDLSNFNLKVEGYYQWLT